MVPCSLVAGLWYRVVCYVIAKVSDEPVASVFMTGVELASDGLCTRVEISGQTEWNCRWLFYKNRAKKVKAIKVSRFSSDQAIVCNSRDFLVFGLIHDRYFKEFERTQRLGNWICFRRQMRAQQVRYVAPLTWRWNRSSFRNVVLFLCSSEYQTMDEVQKPYN
jgi:hypothetical protein